MSKPGYNGPLEQIDECCWRIPKSYKMGMLVEGRIFADERLIEQIRGDQAPEQVANVAFLPGIQMASLAMPDIHWGYGFCIGGVSATDPAEGGVISPGGVGYDINCGVRLMRTNLTHRRRSAAAGPTDGRPVPPDSRRRGHGRAVPVRRQGTPPPAGRGHRLTWSPRLGHARRHRTHRGRRLPARRRARQRQPAGLVARRRPVRHARLGQPLPRSAGGRRGPRRGGRPHDGPGEERRLRDDPFRLPRAGLPGVRRRPG